MQIPRGEVPRPPSQFESYSYSVIRTRRLFVTKNTNFLRKSNRDTYVFNHLPF